jgi:hypothetical protein
LGRGGAGAARDVARWLCSLTVGVMVAGCAPQAGTNALADAGSDGGARAELPVMRVGVTSLEDPDRIDEATARPPDLSCLGLPDPPVRLTALTFSFRSLGEPAFVGCARLVEVLDDEPCASAARTITSDVPILDVPNRVTLDLWDVQSASGGGPARVIAVLRFSARDDGRIEGFEPLTNRWLPTFAAALGRPVPVGTSVVRAQVSDCASEPIYGVELRVLDATGQPVPDRGEGPTLLYWRARNPLPAPGRTVTHVMGGGDVIGLPGGGGPLYLEARGRIAPGSPPTRLACRPLLVGLAPYLEVSLGPWADDDLCPEASP